MDDLDVPVNPPRTPLTDRFQAFVEVLLLSGLISSYFAALIFYALHGKSVDLLASESTIISVFVLLEAAFTLLLLILILKAHRETICSLGLRWERWKSHFLLGLGLVPFFFLINALATFFFRVYLPKYYIEQNPLTETIQTPQQLMLFVFSALVAGGIKEELQRAFILSRFRRYLGGAWLGLVLWSFAFGAAHYVQGVQGITIATLYGFIFGIVYLLSRSLIAPIVAHGVYDTLALLSYWFLSAHSP